MILSDLQGAIAHLKEHIDLVEVMEKEMRLEDAGADLKKGLCCFHEEKSPSLTVTPSKGLYFCFGCHASGDIVSFYKDYHTLSTAEAVYQLATEFSVDIEQFKRELTMEEMRLKDLEKINRHVAEGLHTKLLEGGRGYDYLTGERGFTPDIIERFGLGYSPSHREVSSLVSIDSEDLEDLGLSSSFSRHWEDAIVYPLHNVRGSIIGFKNRPYHNGQTVDNQGRKLPKFLGTSSKSPLHSDSNVYGFHLARKNMLNGRLVIVEGQHDVITAHQYGIEYTAGTDSTALNKAKMKMLEEFGVREIVVVYDGDQAGRESSYKIAESVEDFETRISIKIATLPDGWDPDEFIRSKGKLEFLRVIHESVYASQYLVDQILDRMPITTITGKMDFIKACEPIMLNAHSFERAFIVDYVAEKVGIEKDVIEDMLRTEQTKNSKSLLYNIDGEKIILSGMLRDEDFRLEAMDYLSDDDWYLHKHKILFQIIKEMDQNSVPFSPETVKSTINNKEYKQMFNNGYMIDDIYATIGAHESLTEDIKDKASRRKLISESEELKRKASDVKTSLVMVSEEHLGKVEKIANGNTNLVTVSTPHTGSKDFMNRLHYNMQNPGKITGIELGPNFTLLTSILNGFQDKKLITIAANQSVGKTTITINLLDHIALSAKVPWAHFTLEMPKEEVENKMIGIRAGVNTQRIERGNVTNEEYGRIQKAVVDYHEGGLFIIDDCHTLESIINRTRTLIRNEGVRGISIDYLQLMSLERSFGQKKYEEEGEISGALKRDMAKKLGIPVIAISQMSRRALDRDVQKAEDGQGAYKIAQDSDIYMILQEKSQEQIEEWGMKFGTHLLNVDKNRGGTADVLIDLLFQKDTQRISEVDQREGNGSQ